MGDKDIVSKDLLKRIAIMRGDIPEPRPQGGYHEAVTAAVVPKE